MNSKQRFKYCQKYKMYVTGQKKSTYNCHLTNLHKFSLRFKKKSFFRMRISFVICTNIKSWPMIHNSAIGKQKTKKPTHHIKNKY